MTAAPDYADAILGWRLWSLVPQGYDWRLRSVVVSNVWRPGAELVATCNQDPHRVAHHSPHLQCTCGIYATDDPESVREYVGMGLFPRVLGQVALWGTVVECEHGWRAQRAYPSRLYVPVCSQRWPPSSASEQLARSLAMAYGVPVDLIRVVIPDHTTPTRKARLAQTLTQWRHRVEIPGS